MTTPVVSPELAGVAATAALVEAEGQTLETVATNLTNGLLSLWRAFRGWYDPAAVDRFGQDAADLVIAAQTVAGGLTEQHMRLQLSQLGAVLFPAGPVVDLPRDLRFGAMTADVYQRPVRTARYLTSLVAPPTQTPPPEALEVAAQRLTKTALADLQLARTTSAQQSMYATGIDTFRRIIHPELTGQVCGLCIVAADRIYKRQNLLPIHPGCKCTVLPIVGDQDPGRALNRADLDKLYAAAGGSTRAEDLRRTRIAVTEHGELGPVLVNADHSTRDRRDVQRANAHKPSEDQRRRSLETQIATLRARVRAGGLSDGQASWIGDRIDVLDGMLTGKVA